MSTFEDSRYQWRETYFVLFDATRRPSVKQIQQALSSLEGNFQLLELRTDPEGGFESVRLLAPDAYAALDISFVSGEEVLEQGAELADELKLATLDESDRRKVARLPKCDARFDILHFEELVEDEDDEGMLDPSALLLVIGALVDLTDGIAVDPQSGTLVSG
jgi:hypothetical protein